MGLICSEEMTWEGLCSCRLNAKIKFRAFPVRQCPHTGFQTFPTDGPLAELPKRWAGGPFQPGFGSSGAVRPLGRVKAFQLPRHEGNLVSKPGRVCACEHPRCPTQAENGILEETLDDPDAGHHARRSFGARGTCAGCCGNLHTRSAVPRDSGGGECRAFRRRHQGCAGGYQEQVVIEKPLTLEGITSVGSGRCLGPASNQRVGVNRPDQPEHAADLGEEHCRRDHQQPDRGRGQ